MSQDIGNTPNRKVRGVFLCRRAIGAGRCHWRVDATGGSKSSREAWSVHGTTASGSIVTAASTALTIPCNGTSTLSRVLGAWTPSNPWGLPCSLSTSTRNSVGGNLQTSFGAAGLRSITVTYGGDEPRFSGGQGSALGDISICA